MISEQKIAPALRKIEDLFVAQCTNCAQAANLQPDGSACGQFLGDASRSQRGLHGTAAAIRVLAQSQTSGAPNLVQKLVWYVENREKLFKENREPVEQQAFHDDQNNIIKLSELLYALSFVQASQSHTDTLVESLAKTLLEAQKDNKGWSNFVGSSAPVDPLPTAFAVVALSRHGSGYEQQINRHIEYLFQIIDSSDAIDSVNINETSVRIFCVFALTFRKEELDPLELNKLRAQFVTLWKAHERLFDQDLEQNIEYSNGPKNYYVRIPWQLYLLALAARLDPKRLSSFPIERYLNRVLDAVLDKGFRYPYSGLPISSRTSAILFDVLQKINRYKTRNALYGVYYLFDRIRSFFSNPFFSYFTLIAIPILFAYPIYVWVKNKGEIKELGPEMLVAAMVALLERLRKSR